MIAELLDELTPQLVRQVEAQIVAASELSSALLRLLIRTLRQEHIDVSPHDTELGIGVDVEPFLRTLRLLKQLRQSESRFRVALEHSNIAVFEEDTELRIRWMHNTQLGIDDRAAIGKNMAEFLPVEAATELDALKRRVLESGKGEHTAVDAVIRGERRHLLLNYEPLRAVGGIVGITGAAVDITEAKKVQEELAQALAFRERMMGVLGHDLRNPVSAVLALSGLVQLQEALPRRHERTSGRSRRPPGV
jgi:PAS domain S-box-containing protein